MSQASRMCHSNGSALLRDKNDLLLFLHGMNHSILMMLMLMALLTMCLLLDPVKHTVQRGLLEESIRLLCTLKTDAQGTRSASFKNRHKGVLPKHHYVTVKG